ncbi:hypothetical protein [Flavimaricola marinus]|uniref:Uncharacterized protein n=1 Tax=Flavimaricola marinus TaxID=1819565 RepID=A0A238LAL3_9RHOB|nr:hypothetical protein [Flavimaricola marinus]SMY05940.1 hypothetical protein LOM8899_00061 [Flavimaricola marinus]
MHPPFFVVDHKVGPHVPLPHHERPVIRRSAPEVLRLSLPAPGSAEVGFAPAPMAAAPSEVAPKEPRGGASGWFSRFWRRPQRSHA